MLTHPLNAALPETNKAQWRVGCSERDGETFGPSVGLAVSGPAPLSDTGAKSDQAEVKSTNLLPYAPSHGRAYSRMDFQPREGSAERKKERGEKSQNESVQ